MLIKRAMKQAFSTVEIILAVAVFSVIVMALTGGLAYGVQNQKEITMQNKAIILLDEGIQAVTAIKDQSFTALADGTFGLAIVGNYWTLSGTQDIVDSYVRTVTITTLDPVTKEVTVTVSWQKNPGTDTTESAVIRFTDWGRYIGSTTADWDNPVQTALVNIAVNFPVVQATMQDNLLALISSATTNNFQLYDMTDPANPVLLRTLTVPGAVTDVEIEGNSVFISSENNTSEVSIINITNPATASIISSINLSGNTNAMGVESDAGYIYIARVQSKAEELFIYNVTNPASPVLTGVLNLPSGVGLRDLTLYGNYLFATASSNNAELTVINVTNKAAPVFVAGLNLPGNSSQGFALKVRNATTLAMSRSGSNNVYIINITNPSSPSIRAIFDAGGQVNDLDFGDPNYNYMFLGTANATAELQILDINNLDSPVLLSSVNLPSPVRTVFYDPALNHLVCGTTNTAGELLVFNPN